MTMEIFTWFVSAVALAGVWLNIKKRRACFALWMFSNASWMCIDYVKGIYAQAALNYIYLLLAMYGLFEWSTSEKSTSGNSAEAKVE